MRLRALEAWFDSHRSVSYALVLMAFGVGFPVWFFPPQSNETGGVVVKTAAGPVQGETEKGVLVFRGIRFAAPPVGPLRFRPPLSPSPWTEVRLAVDFAPACPQLIHLDPIENNGSVMAEDCLAVNVWTPGANAKRRPVMVWIHGGGFSEGSARNTWYDGATLAGTGDIVVVSLQYRLGALGFLELAEIGGKDYAESGNLGILDQIAALQWVQQNIAAFGGDPNKVTLFGQSAGSGSEGILLATPAARGLCHQAIMQSGTPGLVAGETQAARVAQSYMKIAGVSSIEGLRQLSMDAMLDAQQKLFETGSGGPPFRPVVDGAVVEEYPMQAIAAGRAAPIPILIGTNLDEIRLLSAFYGLPVERRPPSLLEKQIAEVAGSKAHEVVETYRRADVGYADAVIHLLGDLQTRMPSIRLAEANSRRQPTFMYLFTYRSTSTYKKYYSAHCMELPFVFGVMDTQDVIAFTGREPHREALMKTIQQAWINFARTGDPSQPGLAWPRYDSKTRATMKLGISSQVVSDPGSAERTLWNGTPFDGVTPSVDQIMAMVWENGTS
jgi:para-nitrobenzyl esterase